MQKGRRGVRPASDGSSSDWAFWHESGFASTKFADFLTRPLMAELMPEQASDGSEFPRGGNGMMKGDRVIRIGVSEPATISEGPQGEFFHRSAGPDRCAASGADIGRFPAYVKLRSVIRAIFRERNARCRRSTHG